VLFEDEASFQLDPTLHRTWARVGQQPRVATRGERKTAHIFGAIALDDARFDFAFASVFNGYTFLGFLKRLVQRYRRKVILIIDNAPCHNLEPDGRAWLAANAHRIELHRLPAYSPELNAIEGVWKLTRRRTTHNRYFDTPAQRDAALTDTFVDFQRNPAQLDAQVRRFRDPMAA
jgi:transposase